jgi:acetyl-CoA acyltransferase 1
MAALRTAARSISQKTANDVVILAAVRSPVTRAFKGGFHDAFPEDILGPVGKLRALCSAVF